MTSICNNITMQNDSGDLEKQILDLLNSGEYNEAISLVNSEQYARAIELYSSEIISKTAEKLNETDYYNNQDLFQFWEHVIFRIAEIANPDDALLEFIEYAEKNSDALFSVMLKAMKITLLRITGNPGNRLMWCCNTIIRHISHMEYSEDFELEGEECILLENTDSSRKLEVVYNSVLDFCKPFSIVMSDQTSDDLECEDLKNSFIYFLMKLLGRPLVYMNLEVIKQKGEFRLIAERILEEIMKFKIDLMYFLSCVTPYYSNKKETLSDVTDIEYSNISLAVFYYLIFKEKLFLFKISHVYNSIFVFEMLTTLTVEMLNTMHSAVQYKGLQLFQAAIERIVDYSLEFTDVLGNLYGELSESICKIMIYSEVKTNRVIAVNIFKSFLFKFNSQGRFIILLNIQNKVKSPNFIGYIIPITKDLIMKALNEKNPADLEYFSGQNLRNLLEKFCHLHKGAESDLIELSDQIISTLNLLRFLFIRDKENISGIADFIPDLQKNFLEPLKIGLSLSVAHYNFQKTEIDNADPAEKVNVSIAGTRLPLLPKNQKLEILILALGTLDLLESLRARTQECLEEFNRIHLVK